MCRRAAEYELRRLQALLTAAERSEMKSHADAARFPEYKAAGARDAAQYWGKEVLRLRTRLHEVLSGLSGDEDDEVPQLGGFS
ncbi:MULTISPECIES: hypothetical protein [unclassified Kribbella]|uniref:hypothetical protein n=1 Tax=unclassified Kribbella TaxID=2644121 RepID=UPI0030164D77